MTKINIAFTGLLIKIQVHCLHI